LERRAEAEDRRGCRVRLTPAGISLAERALQAVIGSDTAMLGRVAGLEQLDALAESLRPFTETLDK
jgi:DNA-binding MarR family transcriptional regulator